jgi:hypothetical protein
LDRLEQLPAERRIPLLAKEFNKVIQARNKDLRQQGIKAKMAGADIEQIEEIDSAIFDVEEDPDTTDGAKTSNAILGSKPPTGPSEEEIDAYARRLMQLHTQMAQQNPVMVMKPLSMDEARKIAREELKKKK